MLRETQSIKFFIPLEKVPTSTKQQERVRFINGRRCTWQNKPLKEATNILLGGLYPNKPKKPLTGALKLKVMWAFDIKNKKRWGKWKTTVPDTDNLNKLLKDLMTKLEYWEDDSKVVYEVIQKAWTDSKHAGIGIEIVELQEECEELEEWECF